MNDYFYAQDATDIDAVKSFLLEQMEAAPSGHWLALVDGAFDHGQPKTLQRLGGTTCYRSKELAGLQSASMQLLALQPDQAGQAKLQRLLAHCSARPMLSVINSRLPLTQLIKAWLAQHWVSTSDGQKLLLRFADTRVLPVLPKIFTPQQWAGLAAPIEQWIYITRDGQAACAPVLGDVPAAATTALSPAQMAQLLRAAEPDILLDYLSENNPDYLPHHIARSELYSRAERVFNLAQARAIEDWPDIVALAFSELRSPAAAGEKLREDEKNRRLPL